MKKNIPYYLLPITYLLSQISFASAGPIQGVYQLTEGLREIIYILTRFITDAIFEINTFDEYLFARIILFTIILLIVYTVLKKSSLLGEKGPIIWIISSAISILSIRFIPRELLEFALFQYGTLGAAIAIFFPFIIFLFFLHKSDIGPMPRRIGWIFFGGSYIAIWAFRQGAISGIEEYLYWAGILAIAIAYFFDGQIHAKFGALERQTARREHDARRYTSIQRRINELEEDSSREGTPENVRKLNNKTIKRLRKELIEINKRL